MLMRANREGILRGALIMQRMLVAEDVLVGIEDNKPEAAAATAGGAKALAIRHSKSSWCRRATRPAAPSS
jgi:electron transport complex protein RnfC